MKSRLLLVAVLALILSVPASASNKPLSIDDVLRLSREGVSASVIIAEIESSGSYFDLTTEDILQLTDDGVPQSVIEAMIRTSQDTDQQVESDSESDGYSEGYSTGFGDAYHSTSDLRYRYSFAISLGYYDPWYYYYPWSAYYAACYPYYRVNWWYRPFYAYDPWYYHGHHHQYRSYPRNSLVIATGGRHGWDRGHSRWGSGSPSYVNNRIHGRSMYSRGPGVLPRGSTTSRKPPVYTRPPGTNRHAPATRPSWQREKPRTRGGTDYRKPASPPPSTHQPGNSGGGERSRGNSGGSNGGSNDSGRHYGGRSGGGHSR